MTIGLARLTESFATRSCLFFGLSLLAMLLGCGPSQQELMMRSAQRARSSDDENEPPPASRVEAAAPIQQEVEKSPSKPQPEPNPPPVEIRTGETIAARELIPIEQRASKKPRTDDERRQMAYDNLATVSEALLAYMRDHKRLPATYYESNGFKTLSWRVELLPYLGYAELYKQFDKSVPWNRPPNKDLLQFIPDVYLSPERFDTSTNLVIPSRDGMIGGEGGGTNLDFIEDGVDNTLLLVEVNDAHAVPWTAPEDFAPESRSESRAGVLGLRKDGMFGVWANGWPVLLANELGERIFWDAMSTDAGDGLKAGRVHRDIPLKKVSDASVAAVEKSPEPKPAAMLQAELRPPPAVITAVRDEVPTAVELAKVQDRFRSVFAERLEEAKTDQDKEKLAGEMLDAAAAMPGHPEGVYALQTAAMRVAIEAGAIEKLIEAVDQRIGQFEVDAYEENKEWMLAFGKGVTKKDVDKINGIAFAKRAVRVIFAGIHNDDYVDSLALARYAARLVNQKRNGAIPKYLGQLRGLLGSANREFAGVSDSLANYRIDPDDGESAAAVGRYVCFIKGDWQRGLPLLTKGGPDALKDMASRDLTGAKDHANKVAMGDAWWELSEKARSGVYRQSARDRAVFWYEQAFEVMPESLDRMHVKSRLDEAGDAPPASPLAVVSELAKELGVDLSISLASVAGARQQSSRGDNDHNDDDENEG